LTRLPLMITLLLLLALSQAACENSEAFPPPSNAVVRAALSSIVLKSEDYGPGWSPRTLKFVLDEDTNPATRHDLEQRGLVASFIRSDFSQQRSPDDRAHANLVEQTLTVFRSPEQAHDWVEHYPSLDNRLGAGTQTIVPLRTIDDGPGDERLFARLRAPQSDSDAYLVILRRGKVVLEMTASYPKEVDMANEMFELARMVDDRIVATSVFR
jgi:hypothetical protein